MFNLKDYLKSKALLIDRCLSDYMDTLYIDGRLKEASIHSLMAGGKRLRPILCIASCKASGGNEEDCIHAACAIEMIHTYSLIHDDLPAMDNDDLRRGKPTCHKQFDEATAILAGDALLTTAFEVLSDHQYKNYEAGLEIIKIISRASGAKGMIEGQMRDILSEDKNISLKEMEALHKLKTGALIKASVLTGLKCSGAKNDETENKLSSYADNIGLAFQVVDDILNIEGNPEIMGKAVGTDDNLKKSTYPIHVGLDESKKFAEKLITKAVMDISELKFDTKPLEEIARYIIKRKL